MSEERNDLQGIAIIGMAGRFPGANGVAEFWDNLKNGVESVQFYTDGELLAAGVDQALLNHPDYVKAGAVLQDAEMFDAGFFDFIPKEAEVTDPQQRVFLECAWTALEDAGYDPKRYEGRVGVFGGVGRNSYVQKLLGNPDVLQSVSSYQAAIGNDPDFLATRVSYKFNLSGPAVTVQTACSTSLVATHLAVQSLMTYECDMAMAGGAAVKDPQGQGYLYQEGSIFSPDGHCRAFDAEAQGTVVGNGVGVVVLKRLEDAVADGDHIYAVIKGSALNNDGSNKVGFTAPSVDRQAAVISEALALADVEPETIGYVEAHGTGTLLGDPIEVTALTQAYRTFTEASGYCALGSVKTNVGHLDTAAGVTGLIKAALTLKNQAIPPSLNHSVPNPKIDFGNSPFYVNTELREFPAKGEEPRRAAVSSFGIGGTNAHMILEEAPNLADHGFTSEKSDLSGEWKLLPLSAKTGTALAAKAQQMADYLQGNPQVSLDDVAYTLQVGRSEFKHRRFVIGRTHEELIAALQAEQENGQQPKQAEVKGEASLVFLFPGQGAQYANMGKGLYQTEPLFREQLDLCAELLKPHMGRDIRDLLFPSEDKAEEANLLLKETEFTQPAIFVIEYALAKLWLSRGLQPQAMLGHSIGEYCAAVLADVLTLEEALGLLAKRAKLMQSLPRGGMLAVSLTEADVLPLLNERLSVAAVNGPKACVVAGELDAVEALQAQLKEQGVLCTLLETSHAFHSPMMEPILDTFLHEVKKVALQAPQLPYVSSVTGKWITAEDTTDPQYWVKQLRQEVRFADGVDTLLEEPNRLFLEVGPGRVLGSMVRLHAQEREQGANVQAMLNSLRHRDESTPDEAFLLGTLGELWMNGAAVEWDALHDGAFRRRVPLPTYPFERKRYYLEAGQANWATPQVPQGRQPDMADWFYTPVWKQTVPAHLLKGKQVAIASGGAQSSVNVSATEDAQASGNVSANVDAQANAGIQANSTADAVAAATAPSSTEWLVFANQGDISVLIIDRLKQQGATVTVVTAGSEFRQEEDGVYTMRPGDREDFSALLKSLQEQGRLPQKVAHLWTVCTSSANAAIDWQDRGFYSLLHLAQALGEQAITDPLELFVISNNLQEVSGRDLLLPERATVLGASKVIPQEYAHISGRVIDVMLPETGSKSEQKLVDQILSEFTAQTTDDVVAYRNGLRYIRTYEKVALPETAPLSLSDLNLRQNGVYLITGAAQEQGLFTAELLANTVQANLILLDSQPIPSDRIEALQAEGQASGILTAQADLTDGEALRTLIAQALDQFGEIHGIIHTAETIGSGMIQLKTREMADIVFAPKVKGTLALAQAAADLELDLFLLFSRMQSLTGGFGQVDNTAANAFLDAFARHQSMQTETKVLAVDWGVWRFDNWQDAQATLLPEIQQQLQEMQEQFGLSQAEGQQALTRILGSGLPQVIVSTQAFQAVLDGLDAMSAGNYLSSLNKRGDVEVDPNRPYTAPTNDVEAKVAAIWEDTFGLDRVGIHDNFFDLGGNSLLAVQLVSRLRSTFGVELPMSALFDSATVVELSKVISATQLSDEEAEEIEKMLSEIEGLSDDELMALLASEE